MRELNKFDVKSVSGAAISFEGALPVLVFQGPDFSKAPRLGSGETQSWSNAPKLESNTQLVAIPRTDFTGWLPVESFVRG